LSTLGPEAYGQFEETVALPVQIRLTTLARACNQVDTLASLLKLAVEASDRRLEEVIPTIEHLEE
jgi:hypothetical protein